MEPLHLKIGIMIERESMTTLVDLLKQVVKSAQGVDEERDRRLRASQNALFAGQKPPDDKGLLINTREAAKLMKISERTLWGWWNQGKMPKPIRIGQSVRWGYEELRAWVNAGGPPQEEWKWPQ